MQVRIEDVSPVEKKMFVEIPWETVSVKLGNAYKELGKGAALKGFRKGKVPRPVLEQVYGQRVNAEVLVTAGAGELIEQRDATGERLADRIAALTTDDLKRREMSAAAHKLAHPDAAGAIVERVLDLAKRAG